MRKSDAVKLGALTSCLVAMSCCVLLVGCKGRDAGSAGAGEGATGETGDGAGDAAGDAAGVVKGDRASAKGGADDGVTEPVQFTVNATRTTLVYTYLDASGKYVDETEIGKIPEAARQQVIVVDLSLTPEQRGATNEIVIADLSSATDEHGNYPTTRVSRYAFEKVAGKAARKQWSDAELTAEDAAKNVILYSAPWCGVCSRAKRFMREEGIAFVERDIEASERAAAELEAKARAAGTPVTGVPVFDIGGKLMVGFDGARVRALADAAGILRKKSQ